MIEDRADPALARRLLSEIEQHLPAAVALRHRLHANPDLSAHEGPTRDLMLRHLCGREVDPVADTGALVRIGADGPAIGVRAELDALAVAETTGAPFTSTRPGSMHACGHDVHLAALVALSHAIDRTPGAPPLVAILQPREETYPSGARDISETGLLHARGIRAVIGAHVQPTLAKGEVAATPGAVNAAADEFRVVVHGPGGHAAYPHTTSDPVLALAHIVVALQQVVSRNVDPIHSAVLGVSTLAAGAAANVIPGEASATGTIRALTEAIREQVHFRLVEVAEQVAAAHGCQATVQIIDGEPVLNNDHALAVRAGQLLPQFGLRLSAPLLSYGSDDFAYFAAKLPALMMFVGVDGSARLHSPNFLPGDDAVRDVALALLAGYLAAVDGS